MKTGAFFSNSDYPHFDIIHKQSKPIKLGVYARLWNYAYIGFSVLQSEIPFANLWLYNLNVKDSELHQAEKDTTRTLSALITSNPQVIAHHGLKWRRTSSALHSTV